MVSVVPQRTTLDSFQAVLASSMPLLHVSASSYYFKQGYPLFMSWQVKSTRSKPNVVSRSLLHGGTCRDVECSLWVYEKERFHRRTQVPWCDGLKGPSWQWCSCFRSGGYAGCQYPSLKNSEWGGLWLREVKSFVLVVLDWFEVSHKEMSEGENMYYWFGQKL